MTTGRKPSVALNKILSSLDEDALHRTRDRMLIAGRIADTLKLRGISKKKFAEMLGKSQSEVSELLSGNRNFTIDTLSDMSACLKINILQIPDLRSIRVSQEAVETKIVKTRTPKIYGIDNVTCSLSSVCIWQENNRIVPVL